ncbi:sialate:O-sulfotransferase 2-like [Mytilus trossulus]|uniref:sialate:O-sulfotransferase 2-like n=1 Tax=Mytilus trossulus TaxID=6551 RepID=UPI003005E471
MKTFVVIVAFLQLAIVASLRKRKPVTVTLNAGKEIPVSGFLIDNSKSDWINDGNTNHLDKIKAISKQNSESISAIKSTLTDLSKAVNGLLKTTVQQADPASDGYIGCYMDDGNRHLKYKISDLGNSITLSKCREHCKGYKYTGLQARSYCLCGNKLANKQYPRVPESDCNMPCAGETNRMCGGGLRNSIYLGN